MLWVVYYVLYGIDCVFLGCLFFVERMLLEEGLLVFDYIKMLSGEFRKNWKKLKISFGN